jgi:hypothetical protein
MQPDNHQVIATVRMLLTSLHNLLDSQSDRYGKENGENNSNYRIIKSNYNYSKEEKELQRLQDR